MPLPCAGHRTERSHAAQLPAVQAHANTERAYNFGLYSRNPAWIADHHVGRLFGASEQAVLARIGETIPLFEKPQTPLAAVRGFAARNGVAQQVPGRNLGNPCLVAQALGLGALAGAGCA